MESRPKGYDYHDDYFALSFSTLLFIKHPLYPSLSLYRSFSLLHWEF